MFFITCFEKLEFVSGAFCFGDKRTFGYFDNFNDAEKALNGNIADMHETIYHYALVEEIGQGIHAICKKRWFFEYVPSKDGFFQVSEPFELKVYTNFAIG